MVQFRASVITSDRGLLAYRELDGVLALTEAGGKILADARTGKNCQLVGLLRQSVFGRLAGYGTSSRSISLVTCRIRPSMGANIGVDDTIPERGVRVSGATYRVAQVRFIVWCKACEPRGPHGGQRDQAAVIRLRELAGRAAGLADRASKGSDA
jgi:hypothetical protein